MQAVVICAVGALAWLIAMPSRPRASTAWTLGPDLPAARGELATAIGYSAPCATLSCPDAERLYVLGGLSSLFRPEDKVEKYDARQKLWSIGPSLPAPRHHFAASRLGQDLYVSGGSDVAGVGLSHQYWPPRNGRLYVVGGRGQSACVLIYTPGKDWTTGADLRRMRDHLSVVVAGGRIWAIGGRHPRSIARVDIYDRASPAIRNTWQRRGGARG
jgi:hypothetical protein